MAEILIEVRKFKVEPVKKPQVEGPSIIYPPGSRPPPAPSLPPVSLAPWDASLRQMEGALRDVLNNTIGEKLMDYLPYKDVHSLNGGVFQRSARLSDKKSQAAFKKEYDSLLGIGKYTPSAELKELSELKDLPIHERLRSIEAKNDPGMVSLVSYKLENNTGIFDVMTKELGPSNITASNYYIDLLKKIKDNEPLSQFDFWNVKNTVAKHLNKKHFDAFELTELGRQAQRAKTEMAGIIPTATTRGRSKTPSTIAFSPLDLARSLKTLQKKPVFPVKDPYAQGDLKINEMLQRVDQASTNIEDAYADDIKMTMNRLKKAFPNAGPRLTEQRAVMALDEVTARVWNTEKVDVDKSLDAFVQRHHDGSYKKMVESGGITTTEGRDLIHGIKSHAEDAIERGMGEEEAYKKWAREYNAFMYKRDAWERIINQYYGIEIKTLVKEGNAFLPNTFHKLYDENVEGLVSGTVAFDTYSANILDPTLTNLNMVVRRINTKRPQFAEKGLITTTEAWKEKASDVVKLLSREKLGGFNAERATSAALHPWAIGTLQSQMVRREIAEFAMTNPTKVVAGVLNPLAGSTLLDPKPLHAYYKGMFEDLMKSASKGGTSFVWDKLVKRGIDLPILRLGAEAEDVNMSDLYAEAMTKAHLSALQKVTYEDRINILAKASQPETRKATLYPNLSELIPIFQFNLKEVLNPFSKESKNIFKTLVGRMDIPDAAKKSLINDYVNRVQRSMNATMVGEGVVKAPFQSGAQYTVMGDTTRAWKNIQRAGGSVVGDDLKDVLGSLSSSYKRLAGTNYFAAYGDELKDAMRNLSELAGKKKLDFVSDRLRNDKWSRLAVNTAADFAEGIRTSTISGLLGGWGLWPGFRYLGVNLLTAPIIATAAAGKHGLGTINPQMNYISIGLNGMPVDKVVFETPKGIPYTAGELRYIQGMANKGFSQENLYFATNNAKKIMRDLGLTLKGLPKGKFRSFVEKNLLPTNMNMWSRLAMDTDRHFRNTVRMQGLKNGLSVEAANKVAKKAMLDYGAPSKLTASYASKLILFWRFQFMMGVETVNNLSRAIAADKPSIVTNSMKANVALMRDAETWLYSDDSVKSRLFPIFKKSYRDDEEEELASITAGPAMPTVEAYETLTWIAHGVLTKNPFELKTLHDLLKEGQYKPGLGLIMDTLTGKKAGAKLRDEYIPMWKATGSWQAAIDRYEIVVRDADKQKWMNPAWGDNYIQYEHGSDEGRNRFIVDTFIGTLAGVDRLRKDYSKAFMTGAEDTLEATYGRYGDPNPLLYLIGAETSFPILDPGEKGRRELQRAIRALKDLEQQGQKKGAKEK